MAESHDAPGSAWLSPLRQRFAIALFACAVVGTAPAHADYQGEPLPKQLSVSASLFEAHRHLGRNASCPTCAEDPVSCHERADVHG
jgi:hypothetical protein